MASQQGFEGLPADDRPDTTAADQPTANGHWRDTINAPTADTFDKFSEADKAAFRAANKGQVAPISAARGPLNGKTIPVHALIAPGGLVGDGEGHFRPHPMLNPGMVTGIAGFDEFGSTVSAATTALEGATKAVQDLDEAYFILRADEGMTLGQRTKRLGEAAAKKHEALHASMDNAIATLKGQLIQYQAEMRKPIKDQGTNNVELRNRLFAMGKDRAEKLVGEAVATGDGEVASACLSVHPALTGVSPTLHAQWIDQVNRRNNPQTIKKIAFTETVIRRMENAKSILGKQIEGGMHTTFGQLMKINAMGADSEAAVAKLLGGR